VAATVADCQLPMESRQPRKLPIGDGCRGGKNGVTDRIAGDRRPPAATAIPSERSGDAGRDGGVLMSTMGQVRLALQSSNTGDTAKKQRHATLVQPRVRLIACRRSDTAVTMPDTRWKGARIKRLLLGVAKEGGPYRVQYWLCLSNHHRKFACAAWDACRSTVFGKEEE